MVDWSSGVLFLIINEPLYSKLISAVLLQCQLFLLVQCYSSPADNVCLHSDFNASFVRDI